MKATEALKGALQSTQFVFSTYLSDMTDADLFVRPVPEANHIAWQLGHLIAAEEHLGNILPGVKYPALPAGFADQHNKDHARSDDKKGFRTKAEYLDLFGKARQATIDAVSALTDADLDKPNSGPMAKYAPTLGALVQLVANHTLMHAGQFAVVRRKLGKPILM